MKKAVMLIVGLMMAVVTVLPAYAVTDGWYNLSETTYVWDGTDADRTAAVSADYNYGYGDEESLSYTLPWSFNYYGQSYSSINIDSNGSIWFGNTSPTSSFNLQSTGHGPVISAWNNDLSSQFYSGFFVQHKTNPERVAIEWQTEAYSEEGSSLTNNFEVVLFQTGEIRFDYKTFDTASQDDFGSGISKGDNSFYSNLSAVHNLSNRSFIANITSTPFILADPQNANYEAKIGSSSVSKTFTVINYGSGTLQSSVSITGVDSSEFTKITDTCTGNPINPLQTCSIEVAFAPTSPGVKSAMLSILSNDPNNATINLPLSGRILYDLNVVKSGNGFGFITIDSSPAGIRCGTQCIYTYLDGTELTLTAVPDSSTIFSGWSGAGCAGTGNCTLTLNSDTTVTAGYTTPLFVSTSPITDSSVNTAQVGYILSETVSGGSITFTRTGGTEDAGAPHIYSFVPADMTSGSHTINTGISLVSGAIYTITFDATNGSPVTVSNTNVTYDAAATVAILTSPANSAKVNDAVVSYTLSQNITTGNIVFTRTGRSMDSSSPHTYTLSGNDFTSGSHTVTTGLTLVDGAVYTVSMENIRDTSGNLKADVKNTNVTYDSTAVYITGTNPSNSHRNNASINYTLSAAASSGKVTFTQTGGNADPSSPQVYSLTGTELDSGAHIVNTNLPLVDGALYTVSFDATAMSGNPATTVSNVNITIDTTVPATTTKSPATGATGTDILAPITVTFSEDMDPTTINGSNFTISGVTGTVTYNSSTRTATFTPSSSLAYSTTYTATISANVKDIAGNSLALTTWTFTTARRQISWVSAVSGNWSDSTKWKDVKKNVAVVPTSSDDVSINLNGTYTVTLDTNATVNGITMGGMTGTQTLAQSGYTLTLNGTSTFNSNALYTLSGGTLIGAGNITVANMTWSGGLMSGTGTLTTNGTTTINSTGSATLLEKNWTNNGTVNITTAYNGVGFRYANTTWTNSTTGVINLKGSGSSPIYVYESGYSYTVANYGIINKQSGSAATQSIGGTGLAFNNNGTVDVQSGTLQLNTSGTTTPTSTGAFNTTSGTKVQFNGGPHYLNAGASGTGSGTIEVSSGTLNIGGTVNVAAGTTLSLSGGEINGTGALTINGLFNWSGGTMRGTGMVTTNGTTTINSTGSYTLLERNWTNNSTVNITTAYNGVGFRNANTTWTNSATGVINLKGSGSSPIYVYESGYSYTVANNGTINKQSGSAATQSIGGTGLAFNNNGTVDVQSGTLCFTSTFTNSATGILGGQSANNSGIISITGNLALVGSNTVNIDIGGATAGTQHDKVAVSGTAALGGTLNVNLVNGYQPVYGQTYTIMTYSSKSGTFGTVNLPTLSGLSWNTPTYNGTSLVLSLSDTTPPTGIFTINSGAEHTNNPAVTLALSCADAGSACVQMKFSNDNAIWSTAEAYATTKAWTLTSGDGTKTVYVKFKDTAGNWSVAYSAIISLDATAPVFTSTAPVSNAFVNTASVGYSLSEAVASGNITFTWTGGTADAGSPHVYNFVSADMAVGSHSVNAGTGLVNGAIYTVSFDAVDSAGNAATTVANINITYDATSASVVINSPVPGSLTNNATVSYTLSETITYGDILFTSTGGTTDNLSPHTYTLSGAELVAGPHTIDSGMTLVDGSIYSASFENVTDQAGNQTASASNTNVTYDSTAVAITDTSPSAGSIIATATVSYSLSEQAQSGKATFTWTGGNADPGSPHVYDLSGIELYSGAHTIDTSMPLVSGAYYTVSFDAIDMAGNPATTVSNAMVLFDNP